MPMVSGRGCSGRLPLRGLARQRRQTLNAESILRLAAESLHSLGIPYMVTGSLASALYGEPRSTQDLDIVVHAAEPALQRLGERLRSEGLYCDEGAIAEAVSLRGMFNAIDPTTGWKIDFIVLKDTPFGRAAFEGRGTVVLSGVPLQVARAGDIVVAKLEWARLSSSERQIRDVVGVLLVQGRDLDRDYIEGWVDDLGLGEEWSRVLKLEAENSQP